MNKPKQHLLLEKVFKQDPSEVYDWVLTVRANRDFTLADNWWLGLAEGAADRSRSALDYKWAQVAIAVYDMLAERAKSGSNESYQLSSMMLRAYMASNLGSVEHDPILDVDTVIKWFREGLSISPEEAAQQAGSWTKQSADKIRVLRKIKNRLSILQFLADNQLLYPDAEIGEWLSIRESLP